MRIYDLRTVHCSNLLLEFQISSNDKISADTSCVVSLDIFGNDKSLIFKSKACLINELLSTLSLLAFASNILATTLSQFSIMENSSYVAIRMVNPVECAIEEFNRPKRNQAPEEYRLVAPTGNKSSSKFVLKERFSLCLWFIATVSAISSWFSFTTLTPKLNQYYDKSFLEISAIFWISPVFMAAMLPLASLFTRKSSLPALMVSAFTNALGCAVKCKGTSPSGYSIIFSGQMLIACAVPWSFGFLFAGRKENQSKALFPLGLLALILGCVFGCVVPVVLLLDGESMKETGSKLHAYFLWDAVISTLIFALIPFALKERKKLPDSDYQAFVIQSNEAEQGYEAAHGHVTVNIGGAGNISYSNVTHWALQFKETLLTRKMVSCGLNFAVFLSFFPVSVLCVQDPFSLWPICLLESAVVVTMVIAFLFGRILKKECSKWIAGICQLAFLSSILVFAYILDSLSSEGKYSSFFFMHAFIGLQLLISSQKLKLSPQSKDQMFAALFFVSLATTFVCFMLLILLWKVAVFAWAIGVCIMSIISSICFFLS